MAVRREWEALTPAYRRRLERGGISREAYTQGASLRAARGHATTPERPTRAFRNPDLYGDYLRRRVARGADVPSGMVSPTRAPRLIGDTVGWPGRDTIDVIVFTRSSGGSAGNQTGTMTKLRNHPNGSTTDEGTQTYNQSDFVRLAREARQRGFIVQVVSVPSMGVTA